MDSKDQRIVDALGSKFEQFQKLALMAKEQPATRKFAEAEMARLLNTMSQAERVELHKALLAAGGRTAQLARGRK